MTGQAAHRQVLPLRGQLVRAYRGARAPGSRPAPRRVRRAVDCPGVDSAVLGVGQLDVEVVDPHHGRLQAPPVAFQTPRWLSVRAITPPPCRQARTSTWLPEGVSLLMRGK